MIDFRYHAVSILGVFVALAVGMVLGSIVSGDGTVEKQQLKLIESIQKDINTLREQTNRQSKELEKLRTVSGQLSDWVIAERLKGKTVAFIQMKGSDITISRRLTELIREAGGESRIITIDAERINEYADLKSDNVFDIVKKISDSAFQSEATTEIAGFKKSGLFTEEESISQAQYLVIIYNEKYKDIILRLLKYLADSQKSPLIVVNNQKFIKEKGQELSSEGAKIILFNNEPTAKASFILSFDAPQGIYGSDLPEGKLIPERKE